MLGLLMFFIYRVVFLALKKKYKWSKSLLDRFSPPTEKVPPFSKISHFHRWDDRFLPIPLMLFWKTLACFTFQSRVVEIISTYFSVWLWTVTQLNTPKNEMPLKVLLVIGNGLLIPTWKYWIWISKNEIILRTTAWKGVDYFSILNCVRACHLVSVRKIRRSLLEECKRMT